MNDLRKPHPPQTFQAHFLPPGSVTQRRWSIETTIDPATCVMLQRNQHTLDLAMLLTPPTLETSFDEHFREFGAHLGLARWQFEKYATIGWALTRLPLLRHFLRYRPILNFDHLRHIADTVFPLIDEVTLAELDLHLAEWLEPRIENQALPTPRTLLNFLKRVMEEVDPNFRPIDPKEENAREKQDERNEQQRRRREGEYHVDDRDEGTSTFYLTLAKGDAELVVTAVNKLATREGITKAQALLSLVLGNASISTTLHLYANSDVPMVWTERLGWLRPHVAAPLLEQLIGVDVLGASVPAATESYVPTAEQQRYVRARDGVCRAPGCDVPAHRCEIDHIVPFDAGGETDVTNLHCLCKAHHQLKTARYSHLIMAFSGVQVWANTNDDSLTYTVPQGPLTKHYPVLQFNHMQQAQAERVQEHNRRRAEAAAEAASDAAADAAADDCASCGEPPF
ncbi:HNH endonuclease signature motif containing protein [Corynebacterium ulceribovis]|uniref:HNH endonuclease signature motif containing protein n=1 Tax=Corynebacterium ulceribovis TaxID=487732 RepID=UPI001FE0E35C|nr:HNH endonuclease signature motif containing protein [Corynebacterium ulceribovis]